MVQEDADPLGFGRVVMGTGPCILACNPSCFTLFQVLVVSTKTLNPIVHISDSLKVASETQY
jgi:hypothetical protein